MEVTPERQQDLDQFETTCALLFRLIELFNIMVSYRSLRHRELRNKGKRMREFDTGDLVVVIKQVKSSRKERTSQKLVFQKWYHKEL